MEGVEMILSTALKLITKNESLPKIDKILILASSVSQKKFFSVDFICYSLLDNYNPEKSKNGRQTVVSTISNLTEKKFLISKMPPFELKERMQFTEKFVEGDVIHKGARKTKSVFQITPLGLNHVQEILNKIEEDI